MKKGQFVISLDFELLWGVRDKKTIETYGNNILGVHRAIPRMLECFDKYAINATFSIVGFLFNESKEQLLYNVPDVLPQYDDRNLSPYNGHFHLVGTDAASDKYHYAPDLIRLIQRHANHEIGTHTYSHYYCLEPGQSELEFEADIKMAIRIAATYGIHLTSLIFPRNQFNDSYLEVCRRLGILCYRGNERSWIYAAKNADEENLLRRAFRILDAYVNLSGHHCTDAGELKKKIPVDIPSSRFLRPFSSKLRWLDPLRLRRIKNSMTYAAETGGIFHLWWHPHNVGIQQDDNFAFLEKLLAHYQHLNKVYGFESITMTSLAKRILNEP